MESIPLANLLAEAYKGYNNNYKSAQVEYTSRVIAQVKRLYYALKY